MPERKDVYQLASQARSDVGSATVSPGTVTAGQPTTLTITYTAGSAGVRAGGRLSLFVPYGWSMPQDDNPAAPGAIAFRCSRPGVQLKMRTHSWSPGHFNAEWGGEGSRFRNFWVIVAGEDLREGDTVTIIWGDTSEGGPGTWPAPLETIIELPLCVWTGDGPNLFHFTENPMRVRVKGGRAVRLSVVAPSTLRPSESGDLWIGGRDRHGEVSSGGMEPVTVDTEPPLSADLPEERNQIRLSEVVRPESEGVHRVAVRCGDLEAASNPVEVRADGPRLFWGDPHVHTALSDGLGSLDEAYQYAQEIGALDFCAVTDHMNARGDGPERFRQLQSKAAEYYQPGRFVTFTGFEGTRYERSGDVNLYFLHDDAPMLWRAQDLPRSPAAVIEQYDINEVIAVPHSHIGVHWDRLPHRYCPLFEVYSIWGNSEYFGCPRMNVGAREPAYFYRHGLGLGLRLGAVAGGDDHAGHSGNSRWLRTSTVYPNGLTAVWSDELTRESIFDALRRRRAYATTGARVLLRFTAGGTAQGGEANAADSRPLRVEVHGTADLTHVEIIRNGAAVHRSEPQGMDALLEWQDDEPFEAVAMTGEYSPGPFVYYYVRVTQADGALAWSSPVWFS